MKNINNPSSRLGSKIKPYFEKARESALLAVEVYNKPGTKFKSAAYIALMVIAWTALFHSIFLKQGKSPYKKNKNKRFDKVDGDYRHWELAECVSNYWGSDTANPIRKNLEFFIPLRNKIEHRQIPELDPSIFGECQALLLNFDTLIGKYFGAKHQLREVLSFSLQMFPSGKSFAEAAKNSKEARETKRFIENYRTMLASNVSGSDQYAFKAFLIQVSNHSSLDTLPIIFIHQNQLSPDQQEQLESFTIAVKWKNSSVSNTGLLKPKDVVTLVQSRIDKKFNIHIHTLSWKSYSVRPPNNSKKPDATEHKYCIYDALHRDYGYTHEWVNFLVEKLRDDAEYNALIASK
jgi:hypothetical protein